MNLDFNRKEVEYDEGIIQDTGNTDCCAGITGSANGQRYGCNDERC